ncbi:MAG: MarR family transcriptional regulator [Pseudomonadota bacterium]
MKRVQIARTVDGFMRRLHASVHEKAQIRDRERVGPFGGMVLMAVEEFQPVSIHLLVEHMRRDKSQMTRAVQQLEAKGLLQRAPSVDDGRLVLLSLTEKGQAVVSDLQAIVGEAVETQLSNLEEDERQTLMALLDKAASGAVDT